jgi:hypothetical protein
VVLCVVVEVVGGACVSGGVVVVVVPELCCLGFAGDELPNGSWYCWSPAPPEPDCA